MNRLIYPGRKEVILINLLRKNNNGLIILISLIILRLIGTSIYAFAEAPKIDIWADSISISKIDESNVFIGEGNALLDSDDVRIESNLIQYNFDTEDFLAENEVVFSNSDFELRSGKITGSIINRDLEAVDKVVFIADTLKVESINANYRGEDGLFNFSGNVVLSYDNIEAESDLLTYNEVKEKVYMEGNVKGSVNVQEGLVDISGGLLEIDLIEGTWNISKNSQISYRGLGE